MPLQKTKKRVGAARQRRRALRREHMQAIMDEFIGKSLPPLPAVPGMPGWTRWLKAISNIEIQMSMIRDEMEEYHRRRSKHWKRTMPGYIFGKKLDHLMRVMYEVTGWPECGVDAYNDTEPIQWNPLDDPTNRYVAHQDCTVDPSIDIELNHWDPFAEQLNRGVGHQATEGTEDAPT
jgi:hypothetical protein